MTLLRMEQRAIVKEMGIAAHTAVDWDSFCREVCEIVIMNSNKQIGGEGKRVQIYESKFGKRKYHKWKRVESQWVFGDIDEDSRECFMVTVAKRDRATLLPIIEE